MQSTPISTDMLKTTTDQNNAVYACAGSALQHAQEYEQALKFFIGVLRRIEPGRNTSESAEAMAHRLEKATLGQLLRQFSSKVRISDPSIPSLLLTAVEKRNFLAHRFFLERINLIAEEEGRVEMLRELTAMQALLERAGTLMRAMGTVLEEVIEGTHRPSAGETLFTMEVDEP
jgi:hypothetical protein